MMRMLQSKTMMHVKKLMKNDEHDEMMKLMQMMKKDEHDESERTYQE